MTIILDGEERVIDTLTKTPPRIMKRFWQLSAQFAQTELLKNVRPHIVTGRLERNSYVDIIKDGIEIGVRNQGMMVPWKGRRINYSMFVEHGTKPHIIEPKNKKALRWVSGSKFIFAKKVHHPGYKGDPFLQNTANATFKKLQGFFNKAIQETT